MDKYTILKEIFELENISEKIKQCPKINIDILLNTLSKDTYNLKQDLDISATTVSRYLAILFPGRPASTARVCNYLLSKYQYKHCKNCRLVKTSEEFYKNSSYKDGLSTYCKECQATLEKPTATARTSKYRASKLLRTPSWITDEELSLITKFYKNCPKGYQVDHIIPLQGETVSGFHILSNLQYLTTSDNASKKNKYTPS